MEPQEISICSLFALFFYYDDFERYSNLVILSTYVKISNHDSARELHLPYPSSRADQMNKFEILIGISFQ
jgi:hypothetical protein